MPFKHTKVADETGCIALTAEDLEQNQYKTFLLLLRHFLA